MTSRQATLADAITERLNAGTFSQTFTAERKWAPRHNTPELQTLRVSVAPVGTIERTPQARGHIEYAHTTGVGIEKKIDLRTNTDGDALAQLTQEIADWLTWEDPTAEPRQRWAPPGYTATGITLPAAPYPDDLEQQKWLSILFVAFSEIV